MKLIHHENKYSLQLISKNERRQHNVGGLKHNVPWTINNLPAIFSPAVLGKPMNILTFNGMVLFAFNCPHPQIPAMELLSSIVELKIAVEWKQKDFLELQFSCKVGEVIFLMSTSE